MAYASRRLGVVGAAVLVAATGVISSQNPAMAANGGKAMCVNKDPVVGVWVEVSGGRSGWATRSGSGYSQNWAYNTQGKAYSLTVGCGGSPARWAVSTRTPYFSKTWSNVSCFPGWGYGLGTIYAKDRCYSG